MHNNCSSDAKENMKCRIGMMVYLAMEQFRLLEKMEFCNVISDIEKGTSDCAFFYVWLLLLLLSQNQLVDNVF